MALFQKGPSVCPYWASAHQLCSLGETGRTMQGWCDAAGLQQKTSTSTQTPSFPIVSQPLAGSPSSFHINDSSGEMFFKKIVLLLFCCGFKPGQMLLTRMWCKHNAAAPAETQWFVFRQEQLEAPQLLQDKVYSADLNRARIKTNTQMNHAFVHFARTFCIAS